MKDALDNLGKAALKLQRHLDHVAAVDTFEPCEREREAVWEDAMWDYIEPAVMACWVRFGPRAEGTDLLTRESYNNDMGDALYAPRERLTAEERARMVAAEFCPACQRNEARRHEVRKLRRQTGGLRSAVARLARGISEVE